MPRPDAITRRKLMQAVLIIAGAPFCPETLFDRRAAADDEQPAEESPIGPREIIKGLDGMSRVAETGNTFGLGHNAAAVISSAFFCREQKLDADTQKEILAYLDARLLKNPIYAAPRPQEAADPKLVEGLLEDLDAGIATLRGKGHNIIFAVACLKALRAVPEAVTPARIDGLRKMVRSFGKTKGLLKKGTGSEQHTKTPAESIGSRGACPLFQQAAGDAAEEDPEPPLVGLDDEQQFVHFVFEQFLTAMGDGFDGHVLTIGHALLELYRMGHKELARKGVPAYWQWVRGAQGGDGGDEVAPAPPKAPTPLTRDYWAIQAKRRLGEIVSSHTIKYPYSFYALAKDVKDENLKQRILAKVNRLTATN